MNRLIRRIAVSQFAIFMVIGLASPGVAIPAFARKYHTTCARCHTEFPRLNNYGWNFKMRGYHVPGDEEAGKIVSKDDPFLSLIKDVPLAVHMTGAVNQSNTSGQNPDFALNQYMDLMFADTLGPRMATWVEAEVQKDSNDNGFSADIGNIRLMFTDLVRTDPTALNLEVGRFNPDEFGISDGRRLTQNDYAIFAVGNPNQIGANHFNWGSDLAGFNVYGAFGTGIGVETPAAATAAQSTGTAANVSAEELAALQAQVGGAAPKPLPDTPEVIATRITLDALVKKGTLTQQDEDDALANLAAKLPAAPSAAPAPDEAVAGKPVLAKTDYDVRKGVFYQAGLVTPGIESRNRYQFFGRVALASAANWWVSPVVYLGSQGLQQYSSLVTIDESGVQHFTPAAMGQPAQWEDTTQRLGVEASWSTGPDRNVAGVPRKALDLQAAYMHGRDDNADGLGHRVQFDGGFLEGAYLINDSNLGIVRFDRLSVPLPAGYVAPPGSSGLDVSSITANYTHYLRRNVKVGVEYVVDVLGTNASHQNSNQWSVFYDFVF